MEDFQILDPDPYDNSTGSASLATVWLISFHKKADKHRWDVDCYDLFFTLPAKRQWLISFHKKADKHRWDVDRYNRLQQGVNNIQADLRRLRSPLQTLKPAPAEGNPSSGSNLKFFVSSMKILSKNLMTIKKNNWPTVITFKEHYTAFSVIKAKKK